MDKHHWLAGAIIAALIILLYGSAVRGWFSPKDDWEAFLLASNVSYHPQIEAYAEQEPSFWSFETLWEYAVERDLAQGRFRPTYWIFTTAESNLLVKTPHLWHLETLLIGFVTSFVLYLTLRRLELSPAVSILGAVWLVFAADRLWVEMQFAEEPGLLFTIIALYAVIRASEQPNLSAWDGSALFAIIFAGWIKESFTLVIPALLVLRVLLDVQRHKTPVMISARRLWPGALVFVVQMVIAMAVYLSGGYGAFIAGDIDTVERFSPIVWLALGLLLIAPLSFGLPYLGFIGLQDIKKHRILLAGSAAAVLLWVFPQILLYINWGFYLHYKFPALLAPLILATVAMEVIKQHHRGLYVALFAACILVLLPEVLPTRSMVNRYVAGTLTFQQSIEATTDAAEATDMGILLLSGTYWDRAISFLVFLSDEQVDNDVYLVFTDDREVYGLDQIAALYPEEPTVQTVGIIAAFLSEDELSQVAPDWYASQEWTIDDYSVSFYEERFSLARGFHRIPNDSHLLILTHESTH